MASQYDHPKHPNYYDHQAGLDDATETNACFTPGDRQGEALDAYVTGYALGLDSMNVYLAQQQ